MSADDSNEVDESFQTANEEEISSIGADENVMCAWCGMAEVDNIKLEDCEDCGLVFCDTIWCRAVHRDQHLFTQPDGSHLGECPLCFLPMPHDPQKHSFYPCCSKVICDGCQYANFMSNEHDEENALRCPFCREPATGDDEDEKMLMERVKANDPAALSQVGGTCREEGNYDIALGYLTKAAELGDIEAHYQLGNIYWLGQGVEKDEEKKVYHLEKAAIGGHTTARHNLACYEEFNGNIERAVKHFIIAANLGYEKSMKALWKHYSLENITKEDLEGTLRTHHAAINEMKSPEREATEAAKALAKKEWGVTEVDGVMLKRKGERERS